MVGGVHPARWLNSGAHPAHVCHTEHTHTLGRPSQPGVSSRQRCGPCPRTWHPSQTLPTAGTLPPPEGNDQGSSTTGAIMLTVRAISTAYAFDS